MGEEGTQAQVKSNVVPKITKSLARPPPPAPLSRPSTLSVPLSLSTPPPRPPIFTRLSRASSFPVLDDRRSQPLGLAYFALLVTRRRPVALIPLERPTAHPLESTTLPFSASHDPCPHDMSPIAVRGITPLAPLHGVELQAHSTYQTPLYLLPKHTH
jgi:hypothetical protein